ncbi:MAG: amino acid permease-associated region [Candidatus Angelobacter sp.]|nr:amino acid permease-associated region [Candidatus Angelobacter sp.]
MRKTNPGPRGKLTVLSLAAATYFMVSGGPYGVEELVQDAGYRLAIVILFVTPLIWSLPTGLMVGELAAALPAEGGFYVWVRRAMGPFWGFQEAWLSLVASIFDMAIYPTLFVLYLGRLWPAATAGHRGVTIAAAMIVVCLLWNLLGAKAVGAGSVLLGAVMLSPFVLIILYAFFRHLTPGPTPPAHGSLLTGVLIAMWNYMGWDNASTVANEVENPQKTYPRVMILALAAIFLSYVIPVLAVWHLHVQPEIWSAGSWASIASMVVGPWLGVALVGAAMISEFGTFNSLVMSYSRLPVAMADDGHLPKIFARKLKDGAPWVAIIVLGIAWVASLGLSFDKLIMLDLLLYGASLILEFLALVVLRIREPQLMRPFRVPGGLPCAIALGIGPTALLVIALVKNRGEQLDLGRLGNVSQLGFGLVLMALGVVYYFVAGRPSSDTPSEARTPYNVKEIPVEEHKS